jgi:hypothetical protein
MKKTIITLFILSILFVVPFFIFTLDYLEGMSMLAHVGSCNDRPIPYEPVWIAAEAALMLVFFFYIMLSAKKSNTGHYYKFNRIAVVLLLLNSMVILGRYFQYPYISRKGGGFPNFGDAIVGQPHPFMILLPVSSVLIFYFVLRFNSDMILLGKWKKVVVYAICILIILVRQYIRFTAFYSDCMG